MKQNVSRFPIRVAAGHGKVLLKMHLTPDDKKYIVREGFECEILYRQQVSLISAGVIFELEIVQQNPVP